MNPVTNAKRGYLPENERNFSPSAMKVLRTASGHVKYLKDYDLKQAGEFDSGNNGAKGKYGLRVWE